MEEDFEVFDGYRTRSVKEPLITIQRGGTISLNRAAFQALGKPANVELGFSRAKRIIRIRKSASNDLRGIPVNRQGNSDSYTIAGLTFAKEYDIDISVARRYTGKVEVNSLLIDLNEPSIDATGPRWKNHGRGGVQGKQERRMVRRIAARSEMPDDVALVKSGNQARQEKMPVPGEEIEAILLKARTVLQKAESERGQLSTQDKDDLLKEIKRLEDILNHS